MKNFFFLEQLMSSDQWSLDLLWYGHVSASQRVQYSLALDRSPSLFFFFWPCHACRPHTNLKYKHEFFRQSKQNCWENVTQLGFSWVPHFRGLLFINMLSVWSPSVTGKIYYIWLYVPSFLPYTKCNPCDIEEYISYIR